MLEKTWVTQVLSRGKTWVTQVFLLIWAYLKVKSCFCVFCVRGRPKSGDTRWPRVSPTSTRRASVSLDRGRPTWHSIVPHRTDPPHTVPDTVESRASAFLDSCAHCVPPRPIAVCSTWPSTSTKMCRLRRLFVTHPPPCPRPGLPRCHATHAHA